MNHIQQGELIKHFFEVVKQLKDSKVIRSDRYLGDLGEYIAEKIYQVDLSKNQREQTIDGKHNNKTVQVKFNTSPTKTNINVGKTAKYDLLILILTKGSLHFPNDCFADFVGYEIPSKEVQKTFSKTAKETYSCTKKILSVFYYKEITYKDLN